MATKWITGHLFDGWINVRYVFREMGKNLDYMVDDALDVWGDDE